MFDTLEAGAEADVRNARLFLDSTADLERLFPGSTVDLLSAEDSVAADELLASERFHERLPELRSVIRGALDRTERKYTNERSAYDADPKKSVSALEAEREWTKLSTRTARR